MNFAIVGQGRMGRAIAEQALARGHRQAWAVSSSEPLETALATERTGVDVAFEFSRPEAAEANVIALLTRGVPTVCGTTGWTPGPELDRALAGSEAGLVLAPNFSAGMNVFMRLVSQGAKLFSALGLHDPYVLELHHRGKRDVPSGTARRIAELIATADPRIERTVEGHPSGPLPPGALQVVGIRAGAEPGTHVVGFDGVEDVIELRHTARGRSGFALGAVLAAEWLGRRSGLYSFDEVMDAMLAERDPRHPRHEGGTT